MFCSEIEFHHEGVCGLYSQQYKCGLLWRWQLHQHSPGIDSLLQKHCCCVYIPTVETEPGKSLPHTTGTQGTQGTQAVLLLLLLLHGSISSYPRRILSGQSAHHGRRLRGLAPHHGSVGGFNDGHTSIFLCN